MQTILAYFDPGAGSLMLQALLGGAGGVLMACRCLWQQYVFRRSTMADLATPQDKVAS